MAILTNPVVKESPIVNLRTRFTKNASVVLEYLIAQWFPRYLPIFKETRDELTSPRRLSDSRESFAGVGKGSSINDLSSTLDTVLNSECKDSALLLLGRLGVFSDEFPELKLLTLKIIIFLKNDVVEYLKYWKYHIEGILPMKNCE